ncbi:MAG: VCBS repeat-containing protein [Candidatus Eiseniibacteriota bacterium]|nr:MAG: VCBS repeat-containing protein [Candidatus Eisenbacteria bacterium]
MVYANNDGLKDLLVGLADGRVKLYLNVNTDENPLFNSGGFVQVGEPGLKGDIDVGSRAAPTVVDWNSDGKRDLVVGALDGKLHIFLNEGADSSWDFRGEQLAIENAGDLLVPTARLSPHVMDLDEDAKKDLLSGNTEGQLVFYSNVGSDEVPTFSGYTLVEADGVPINLPSLARSRPFVCDWSGDGRLDVLIGSSDGLVRLYQGTDSPIGIAEERLPRPLFAATLLDPCPNPFNPDVKIPFVLFETCRVRVSIYDISGRQVAVLGDRSFTEGVHQATWDGADGKGQRVSSGVYFVLLDAGGYYSQKKVVLLR